MKFKNTLASMVLAGTALSGAALTNVHADVAIIVSPKANINKIDQDVIARIFLGKTSSLPNGEKAVPVDLEKGSPVYNEFAKSVLGKTPSQLSTHWSRLIFTGRAKPNKQVNSAEKMKELVASNANFIGYIDGKDVDSSVVVVHRH